MHTQRLSVENRRSSRDVTLGRAAICFVGSLLAIFSAQDGLGQGFKVTQLNIFNTPSPYPSGVNSSEAMVGNYENSSSGTSGFLYSGGQYTSLVFPGSDNFTRASGINDSCTVAGDFYDGQGSFHGYTYVNNSSYAPYQGTE